MRAAHVLVWLAALGSCIIVARGAGATCAASPATCYTSVRGAQTSAVGVGVEGDGTSGVGVKGNATSGVGVVGLSGATSAPGIQSGVIGVYGSSAPTDGGNHMGVYGSSSTGDGGHFLATAAGYAGVYGSNQDTGSSYNNNGVVGKSAGTNGSGVYAYNSSEGNGLTAASDSGTGVYATGYQYGIATFATTYGLYAEGLYGVYGATNTGIGVEGGAFDAGGTGVLGVANGSGGSAIYGIGFDGADAGLFSGSVTISDNLTVSGSLTVTGDINGSSCSSGCSSDRRLKENIEPLEGALDALLQLKGVDFEWREPSQHKNHTGRQIGVIAQDVEDVFPQWVGVDRDGFKTVDPDARTMVALTVESIRTLKVSNDDLRAENRDVTAQLAAVKAENDQLRARVSMLEADRERTAKLEERMKVVERALAGR